MLAKNGEAPCQEATSAQKYRQQKGRSKAAFYLEQHINASSTGETSVDTRVLQTPVERPER